MSKRRKRKSQNKPNLPEATLDRARREAGLIEDEEPIVEEAAAVSAESKPAQSRQQSLPPAQKRRRREVDPEELTHEEIAERLAKPTRFVTVGQLRDQYTYVIADLRGMGLLAALLFIAMIVAARFL